MKKILLILMFSSISMLAAAQSPAKKRAQPDTTQPLQIVEASCGQCKFGLPGKGCNLAVRINGKAYFVDGSNIDDHGDAHAADGFCEAIRPAQVQGTVVNNRFKATYFKVLPMPKKKG
jgi:hypothetical protein